MRLARRRAALAAAPKPQVAGLAAAPVLPSPQRVRRRTSAPSVEGTFRIDLTADAYGTCVCGALKSAHLGPERACPVKLANPDAVEIELVEHRLPDEELSYEV